MVVEISPSEIRSTASKKSGDFDAIADGKTKEIVRTGNLKCSRVLSKH